MTSAWALYLRSVLSSSGRTRTGSPVADRKSTRLNSSHLVISYAVLFFKKNTRLNSSHLVISYAVFCLKKKKENVPLREPSPVNRDITPNALWNCIETHSHSCAN